MLPSELGVSYILLCPAILTTNGVNVQYVLSYRLVFPLCRSPGPKPKYHRGRNSLIMRTTGARNHLHTHLTVTTGPEACDPAELLSLVILCQRRALSVPSPQLYVFVRTFKNVGVCFLAGLAKVGYNYSYQDAVATTSTSQCRFGARTPCFHQDEAMLGRALRIIPSVSVLAIIISDNF